MERCAAPSFDSGVLLSHQSIDPVFHYSAIWTNYAMFD